MKDIDHQIMLVTLLYALKINLSIKNHFRLVFLILIKKLELITFFSHDVAKPLFIDVHSHISESHKPLHIIFTGIYMRALVLGPHFNATEKAVVVKTHLKFEACSSSMKFEACISNFQMAE